jgi:hypothetical protein
VCLKQNADTIMITASDAADARELATTDLSCDYCHKALPHGYFVHTLVLKVG